MRNIKGFALIAAAALLTIGAAFTSMAATYNWYQEDGIWHCKDKNGDDITDDTAKSGADIYYLNEDGEMATEAFVDIDDDHYYFDEEGKMVKNQWIKIENDEDDDGDEFNWYYFQASGKSKKGKADNKPVSINGKKYMFDEDGKMLYGWIVTGSSSKDDDYAWQDAEYYAGGEDDGAIRTGWAQVEVEDNREDNEEQVYWFYFGTNGKKTAAVSDEEFLQKSINGKKYAFDNYGVMKSEWVMSEATASVAEASISSYAWFQDAETGAKLKKGWFRVIPQSKVDTVDNEEETPHWFYAKGNGELYSNVVKTINGKKYAFNEKGEMLSGLYVMVLGENGVIENALEIDTEEEIENLTAPDQWQVPVYLFGDEATDGSMKYNAQKIDVDGEEYNLLFNSTGAKKGQAYNGLKGSAWYVNGKKICADSDVKYEMHDAFFTKLSSDSSNKIAYVRGKSGSTSTMESLNEFSSEVFPPTDAAYEGCCLVSSSGALVKSGTKKDADDIKYEVKNYVVLKKDGADVLHDVAIN